MSIGLVANANLDSARLGGGVRNVSRKKETIRILPNVDRSRPLQNSLQQARERLHTTTEHGRGKGIPPAPLSKQNRSIVWVKCCVGAVAAFAILYWLSQQITSATSIFRSDSCSPCIDPCHSECDRKACFGASSTAIISLCSDITELKKISNTLTNHLEEKEDALKKCATDLSKIGMSNDICQRLIVKAEQELYDCQHPR